MDMDGCKSAAVSVRQSQRCHHALRFSAMPLLEFEMLLRINVLPLHCFPLWKNQSFHLILSEAAAVFGLV